MLQTEGSQTLRRAIPGLGWAVLAAACLLAGCVTAADGRSSGVIRAKNRVAPALVHIRPVKEVFTRGQREEVLVIGSGFIISADGYVVTNEHVAGESNFVKCVLGDRSEVEAKVVGVDPDTDIAVLKLETDRALPFVKLGDSDKLDAGQTVIALGSPHGLARSVSLGIVSVTDRYLDEGDSSIEPCHNWIQTDAAINRGNSGGPLVNLRGEVVGVNARMLLGAENVGFAIPINTVKEVVDAIIAHGRVPRSWLGVHVQEMLATTDDPSKHGVIIADVDPHSPASEAGLQPGDVLTAANGTPVNARFEEDLPAIRKLLSSLAIGGTAQLAIQRGEENIPVTVTPEERGAAKGEQTEFEAWGFTATGLTPAIIRRAGLEGQTGIVVSGTQPGRAARNAGLNDGDIILQVDGAVVTDLAQFRQTYDARVNEKKPSVLLFIKRGALTRFVLIEQQTDAAVPAEQATETE